VDTIVATITQAGQTVLGGRLRSILRSNFFFKGTPSGTTESFLDNMKRAIDSPERREKYRRRFATAEQVFCNLRYNKGPDRLALRGEKKVDAQGTLFCHVHNIEKLAHNGYAQATRGWAQASRSDSGV
jgi:Transposase DDE domain